ncbi:MAG: hypothetical protein ACI8Q2_000477 [Candidatus Omnitrophota bacterium]|jgi:hypothetical protein
MDFVCRVYYSNSWFRFKIFSFSDTGSARLFCDIFGVCILVFCPIISEAHYQLWITLAQGLWIVSFSQFLCHLTPILVKA